MLENIETLKQKWISKFIAIAINLLKFYWGFFGVLLRLINDSRGNLKSKTVIGFAFGFKSILG